ncbi:hypothetical protein AVEN_102491-1 [Araneus ventricosus]|uniref:Uncharacterized protein n=2 Tax=Araneus ventricosus TaxID=182803 RepID=A0A4Y1ZZZ8_ARAVE|nr:hypothetical protein AVEN_102491-1 [Araneus ventricosus]
MLWCYVITDDLVQAIDTQLHTSWRFTVLTLLSDFRSEENKKKRSANEVTFLYLYNEEGDDFFKSYRRRRWDLLSEDLPVWQKFRHR